MRPAKLFAVGVMLSNEDDDKYVIEGSVGVVMAVSEAEALLMVSRQFGGIFPTSRGWELVASAKEITPTLVDKLTDSYRERYSGL